MSLRYLQLNDLARFENSSLLFIRVVTGSFLIHGVWDNIVDPARMQEFVAFLKQVNFLFPQVAAPLTVWMQLFIGIGLVAGLLTRWSGLLCMLTFIVACATVHWHQDFRAWWPALALVCIGLLSAVKGGGKYSLDSILLNKEK